MKQGSEATASTQDELGPTKRRNPVPEERTETEKLQIFGDKQQEQPDRDTERIEGINMNTAPSKENDMRMIGFKNWAITSNASILPLTELNHDYDYTPMHERMDTYMKSWWHQSNINLSWLRNYNEDRTKKQYGGVALITTNRLASTICKQGADARKLGRWAWTTYRGKRNYRTTVICLYFPQKKTSNKGSVYMQQATVLDQEHQGKQLEPHKEYIKDLRQLIKTKIEDGENILVAGDFNQNLQKWNTPIIYMLRQLGLRELIEECHNGAALPPTFSGGKHAIDGIWGTSVFKARKAGYKQFGNHFSSHRSYWVDIPIVQILGEGLEAIVRPKGRRLQCHIPSIKRSYNERYDSECEHTKLIEKLEILHQEVLQTRNNMTDKKKMQFSQRYAALHSLQRRCQRTAENNCSKMRTGAVPFSDVVNKAMGAITVWKLLIKRERRKGKKNRPHAITVRRQIKRWKFKDEWKGLSVEQLRQGLKNARTKYYKMKPNARSKREEFYSRLALERAMEDGLKPESHLKQIQHIEAVRTMFRKIKSATKKIAGGVAKYVEQTME